MHFTTSLAIGVLATLSAIGAAQAHGGAVPLPPPRPLMLPGEAPIPLPLPAFTTATTPTITLASLPDRASVNPAHEAAAPTIDDLVVKHAHDNGVPVGLANAVIRIESRFNPKAANRGALGLMQIKADTARNVGFEGAAVALLTPDTNLRYGMKVLAQAYRASHGDICRTLAFYQSGHQVRSYTQAQRSYCSRARAFMAHA